MFCPHCGARAEDGAAVCPACGQALPPAAEAAAFARLDKKNRSGDRIALTAPVKQGGYALLELDYGAYLRELTQIEARLREEIC